MGMSRAEAVARAARPPSLARRGQAAALAVAQRVGLMERSDEGHELQRILSLPVMGPPNDQELENFRLEHTLPSAYHRPPNQGTGPFRWNRSQAWAIQAFLTAQGMDGFLPVGEGKTLILQYIASLAYREGVQKMVLIVPKGLIDQFLRHDLKFCKENVPFNVPVHSFGDMDPTPRKLLATSGKRGLYLLPYSLLSREASATVLFDVCPELLLIDEAYHLRNQDSAVTKRVRRFINAQPNCRVVCVAGSVSDKAIEDYAHLVHWGLKDLSPLPRNKGLLTAWSSVISSGAEAVGSTSISIYPLLEWAREQWPDNKDLHGDDVAAFREAYRLRISTAPGMATSDKSSLGTSLVYRNRPVPGFEDTADTEIDYPGWRKLCALIDQLDPKVRGAEGPRPWLTPDGEQVDHAIHAVKWARELASGFYYSLVWPEPAVLARRRKVTVEEAEGLLDLGKAHQEKQAVYHRLLRVWLENHPDATGTNGHPIDTPLLVGAEMKRTGARYVNQRVYTAWRDMKDAECPGMPPRDKKPVRVCDFKVRAAVEWAKALPPGEGALLWYFHNEVGQWLYEELQREGLPCLLANAGMGPALRDPSSGSKLCVASIKAHHKGLNLQGHHWNVYVVQSPRSSIFWEQLVGRVHRQGQKKDEISVVTCHTLPFDHASFAASMIDALYQHETGAGRQKLIYGSFDPLPQEVDPAVLKRQGLVEGRLPMERDRILSYFKSRFGKD